MSPNPFSVTSTNQKPGTLIRCWEVQCPYYSSNPELTFRAKEGPWGDDLSE
jgi:hypothetical protein